MLGVTQYILRHTMSSKLCVVREMRALYTTDHCDTEGKKYRVQDTMPKRQENRTWYVRQCVYMRVNGEGTKGASLDIM